MSLTRQISEVVEQMPEKKQALVFEFVKAMVSPDDILSDEDVLDIKQARAEFATGKGVSHEDIDWD